MAVAPITAFPPTEAACVFECLQGTCKDDDKCKLHSAAVFLDYAQYCAQTVAQPAGLHSSGPLTKAQLASCIKDALDEHKRTGRHALNLPWLQIAQAVLMLIQELLAGILPAPAPTPAKP